MKLNTENKKKLDSVRKALLLGVPISGMLFAAGGTEAMAAEKESADANAQTEQKEPAKKTVSIDPMSLYHRRFSTPGIMMPRPLVVHVQKYVVKAGETWESLAERYKTTVEIMLRINGVPAETVWKIFDSWLVDQLRRRRDPQSSPKEMDWENIGEGAIPENLKLVSGQEIYVPEKISRE